MRPRPRHSATTAFTLIELAVAVAILVGGLAGILTAVGRVLNGAMLAVTMTQATTLAQSQLAELALAAQAGGAAPGAGEEGRFRWTTAVAPWSPAESWQLRTATVTWAVHRAERQTALREVAWVAPAESP
ncbi:MAG: hypothetical protein HY600_01740 [Candidatus Omnitrophica bacterium]|nr:hypothetical protein [Candidatus Omnitrophota bacterium]